MNCPKCGYTRKAKETVPETQCPSCGIYYAKFVEPLKQTRPYIPAPEPKGRWGIGTFVFVAAVAGGIAAYAPLGRLIGALPDAPSARNYELPGPGGRGKLSEADFSRTRIVMYSLTTCGYCTELRHVFEANKVPFTEYFIDTDQARQDEMFAKLQASGLRGGGVGTPTLEVNGMMMPNNPPIDQILKQAL